MRAAVMFRPRTFLLTAAAALLAACSTPTPLPTPLTVTQPLARTALADRRADFATLFARELAQAGDTAGVARWLRLPAAQAAAQPGHTPPPGALHGISVLIAPGLFSDCVASQALPFSDGVARTAASNYVQGYDGYADLGLHSIRAIPLWGRASTDENGALLADALRREAQDDSVRTIILIGYSKGVADALQALTLLQGQHQLPAKLRALVSVAGTVNGTVLADRHRGLYDALAGLFSPLECTPSRGGEVDSLGKTERLAWLAAHALPPSVRLYSAVASTDAHRVAPGLAPTYRQLAALGDRNDGQMLVQDAILPGSQVLAEVQSDHWNFVLPLERSPSALVRAAASDQPYPRQALLRALVRFVAADLAVGR